MDTSLLIILLIVLNVILLFVAVGNNIRLSRLEKKYKMFMKGSDAQSLEKSFSRKFTQIDRLFEKSEDYEHDISNSGLILNAVHSRDNCFLYLKEIVKGESFVMLSQEEVEALRKAVNYGLGEIEE